MLDWCWEAGCLTILLHSQACNIRIAAEESDSLICKVQGQEDDSPAFQSKQRLVSLLTLALEELPDVPLYYNVHDLAKALKAVAPPQDAFRSALVNAGQFSHHIDVAFYPEISYLVLNGFPYIPKA